MSKLKPIVVSGAILISSSVLADSGTDSDANSETMNEVSSNVRSAISFAGYSGIFNTPTAEVLQKGRIDFSYNNQLDYRGNEYQDGHNFVFAAGLFDGLEIGGMIATNSIHDDLFRLRRQRERGESIEGQKRDLSFNLKYQLPIIPDDWFKLAVGVKDFGGAANQYETYYVAGSKEWRDFRFSAGVASSDRSSGQMDGVFAGIEWQPLDWLGLQLEHDADAVNAGARITIPKEWLYDIGTITLTGKLYSNTEHAEKDRFWGVSFSMPLSRQAKSAAVAEPAPQVAPEPPREQTDSGSVNFETSRALSGEEIASNGQDKETEWESTAKVLSVQARELRDALVRDGFESVSVGFNEEAHIVVRFENFVFNRNDIDAFGLVLGRITEYVDAPDANYSVQLLNHGIPMLAIHGSIDNYRQFIHSGAAPDMDIRRGNMVPVNGVAWAGIPTSNSPYFKPRLAVGPALSTRIATELGVYDFSLALQADVTVPMWYGGGVSVSAQTEVANTDDYEDSRSFNRFTQDRGLTQATIYQTFALPYGFYNQTHVGFFREYSDYTGVKNETAWLSENSRHMFNAKFGYLEFNDFDGSRDFQTLSYRYNWFEKDVSFHATAGKFLYEDKGATLETRFWFGDSYIALFAKNTDVKIAGIAFSVPLTRRKDLPTTRYGQVKGNEAWRHDVSSRISESTNAIASGRGEEIETVMNLERTFFNQGRLSGAYILNNLDRLREAYWTYR